jgi:riboflavin kinase/FMN adenylyltransferase
VDEIEVALLDLQMVDVSSSLIRFLLAHGRVRDAAICLGRPYALEGEVIEGNKRGRTIGIPTANLRPQDQLIPADGVYAGRCDIDGRCYEAAISIGTNPTFNGRARQVEAHLLKFDGNLYGRTLRLEFVDWVREQVRFGDAEALKAQVARDLRVVAERSSCDPARAVAQVAPAIARAPGVFTRG